MEWILFHDHLGLEGNEKADERAIIRSVLDETPHVTVANKINDWVLVKITTR